MNRSAIASRACFLFMAGLNAYRHRLGNAAVLVTTRCNSRCKHCGIWQLPHQDMPPDLFRKIVHDDRVKPYLSITGGEAILHPQIEELLQILEEAKRPYTLFSNGLLPDKVCYLVRKFKIKQLELSRDGFRDTYLRVRGVDGFARVCKIIEDLKDETHISVVYVMNGLNGRDDLKQVREFCEARGLYLGTSIYDKSEFNNAEMPRWEPYEAEDLATYPASKYIHLYNDYRTGHLHLPCYSIRQSCPVLPNGDVMMCQFLKVRLGNLNQASLSDVWDSRSTMQLHRDYVNCNQCWMYCHRIYDISMTTVLRRLFPRMVLNRILGNYDWDKV